MTVAKANEWGDTQVGTTESPPGSNFVKYWVWFKNRFKANYEGQPWCGCYAIRRAFAGGLKLPENFISVLAIQNWGVANKRWTLCSFQAEHTKKIKAGDLTIIGGPGVHVETAVADAEEDGSVLTNGGNTTPEIGSGDQFNGGAVAKKPRQASEIYGFVSVHDKYPGGDGDLHELPSTGDKTQPQYSKEARSGALKLWNTGPRVAKLQIELGIISDGYYGKSTAAGVAAARKRIKIKGSADEADEKFLAALAKADAKVMHKEKIPETLHQGDLGGVVRKLQRMLTHDLYISYLKVDGDYGEKTAAAVTLYKQQSGMKNTDGEVFGEVAWKELLKL